MRWMRFNAVGAMGGVVHLGLLAFFVHILRVHYLVATAVAVEAAILHNFIWHRRWTWADRLQDRSRPVGSAMLRFNLTAGSVSLGSNLLSACVLTGFWKIDPVLANLVSIALGSLANLFFSDRFVFTSPAVVERPPRRPGRDRRQKSNAPACRLE